MLFEELEFNQRIEKARQKTDWADFLSTLSSQIGLNPNQRVLNRILNAFIFKSPYGHYACAAYEMTGTSLSKVIQTYYSLGVSLDHSVVARIIADLAQMMHLITQHCGIINLGITPHSVLLVPTEEVCEFSPRMASRMML